MLNLLMLIYDICNMIYDIDDLGDNNKWTYSLTLVGASVEDALLASVPFLHPIHKAFFLTISSAMGIKSNISPNFCL